MKMPVVPKFESEDQEAQWWYDNRRAVEANLLEATRNGTATRLTQEVLLERLRGGRVMVPRVDFERARKLSRRKKVDPREYLLSLLHKALDREEGALKRAAARKSA
jgi:hypothetical protein